MRSVYLFLFIYLEFRNGFAYLNQEEEKIITGMMDVLETQHWILVEDFNCQAMSDLNKFKLLAKSKTPFACQSVAQLTEYFLKDSFFKANTLIVFKVININIVTRFFKKLIKNEEHDYLCSLNWIILVEDKFSVEEENELPIPYECLFIVVQQRNPNHYFLKEIYKVKKRTFSLDYGTWDNISSLKITPESKYVRRMNLDNATIVIQTFGSRKCTEISRRCIHLEIIKDYSKLMNFRLDWNLYPVGQRPQIVTGDILHLSDTYLRGRNYSELECMAPLFKTELTWFIRKPTYQAQADYYIHPFTTELWLCLLILLIIGTFFGMILPNFVNKSRMDRVGMIDLSFMTFENVCSQDGFLKTTAMAHRIALFSFRFFALFILPSYSGTIISFLALRKPMIPFQNLHAFAKQKEYKIVTANFGFPNSFFQINKDPVINKIYKNSYLSLPPRDIMDKVCYERFAYVGLDKDIYSMNPGCPIYRLKKPIASSYTFILFNKNYPFVGIFNYLSLKYFASGIRQKLQDVLTGEEISSSEDNTFYHVTVEQMVQVLSIIPIGIFLAITIFLCEIVSKFFRRMLRLLRHKLSRNSVTRKRTRNKHSPFGFDSQARNQKRTKAHSAPFTKFSGSFSFSISHATRNHLKPPLPNSAPPLTSRTPYEPVNSEKSSPKIALDLNQTDSQILGGNLFLQRKTFVLESNMNSGF